MDLLRDIENVLLSGGISFRSESFAGVPSIVCHLVDGLEKVILPIEIIATSMSEAANQQSLMLRAIDDIKSSCFNSPIIITEDRWLCNRSVMSERLLAHLGIFTSVFARNCIVDKVSAIMAASFLERTHSYGDAKSRYHYGIFHKGELVAIAEFSSPRRWNKTINDSGSLAPINERIVSSYEWVRYASLPGVRVIGGMGKVLKYFINEKQPDDVMSYADLEWSEGGAYRALGFQAEGSRMPVAFEIGPDWRRHALALDKLGLSGDRNSQSAVASGKVLSSDMAVQTFDSISSQHKKYFLNFGSVKYRLKLTDYK